VTSLSSVLLKIHVGTVLNCSKDAATPAHGLVFFSERVVNAWHSLPRNTNFNSVAGVKHYSVAKVDFTEFLKGELTSS